MQAVKPDFIGFTAWTLSKKNEACLFPTNFDSQDKESSFFGSSGEGQITEIDRSDFFKAKMGFLGFSHAELQSNEFFDSFAS